MLLLLVHVIILMAGVNESFQIWISKVDPIGDESLKVQAIVVKDEEVTAAVGCKANTATRNNNDVRYSTKRYLMCVGSILTSRYILTSASCIHEATHIRHNIRAPLAVMIAPFSDTAQVIKVAGYSIHPKHLVDPRDEHYTLHNVAVVKLVCRISKRNLHEIKLPVQPLVDQCAEDDCKVTITKEIGPMSFVMYEVLADNIGITRKKRELLVVSKRNNSNETVNETHFNNHDIKKVLESNENSSDDARIIETRGRRASNENSKNIESNFKSKKTVRNFQHSSNRKLVTRESNGIKGCPRIGSAVMSNKIQTAMVTVSCDDRQAEKPCQYTDLFGNLDWINEMIGNWKPTNPTLTASCNTCIYNFFIDGNCKNRKCQKNDVKIPVQLLPKCSENNADSEIPFTHNHPKNNDSQLFINRAYIDAINNLYLDKHNHADDNEFKPDLAMNEKSGKNSYRIVDETVKLRLFSQSPNNSAKQQQQQQRNSTAEKTLVLDYKDNQADLQSNYRKVKATYDNDYKPRDYADGNEYEERENRDYQPRYNQIKKPSLAMADRKAVESLRGLVNDGRFDEHSIPKEWAELYKKFLEEYEQSKGKINKNIVRRAQ